MSERWAAIPDWDEKQHYKKGRGTPPWIKLHSNILSSRRFQLMPLASKALAPQLWLLATKHDGRVNVDIDELTFQLRWPRDEIEAGVKGLIENAYLELASNALAECKHDAIPETEEETEIEEEKKERARKRATRLPEDFQIPEDWISYGLQGGLSKAEIDLLFEEMKTWSLTKPSPQGKSLDWKRTFQTWCRRHKSWGVAVNVSRETSSTAPTHEDPECQPSWESMRKAFGDAALNSWFMSEGKPALRKNCEGFVIEASGVRADRIQQQFAPRLNDVLGKKNWRIEAPT